MLKVITLILILILPAANSYGSDHCITIEDAEYCKSELQADTKIVIGDEVLIIKDPFALLQSATGSQINRLTKVSLWEKYEHPPFIKELARQNGMDVGTLIDTLAAQELYPNPWFTIKELELLYPEIVSFYGREVIDTALDTVVTYIIDDVTEQITDQFKRISG
ncbi:MAG: hypothetical protein K0U52_12020 [Gammaproteobacteria bacterium]|nr:hypothetical protein [Gammaproteobacteria bacterium]